MKNNVINFMCRIGFFQLPRWSLGAQTTFLLLCILCFRSYTPTTCRRSPINVFVTVLCMSINRPRILTCFSPLMLKSSLPLVSPVWFRPPDFLIFTGLMVYLVRLFQDTELALRATEVSTGRQRSNTEEKGSWRRVLLVT